MRLGIFGGTFDPIHYAHLRMAEESCEQLSLGRVLFVPNQVSPFKTGAQVTPGALRAEMARRAIADNPGFAVSEIEIERPGPSFTVDTLRAFSKENPGAELFFLTGTDAVRDLPKWREPEALLELAVFVVAARPGVDRAEVLRAMPDAWESRIAFIDMPGLDISATDLRALVRAGRSIRYLTPPAVEEFIREHGLYWEGDNPSRQGNR